MLSTRSLMIQRHKEAASEKQNKTEMFFANSEVRRRGRVIDVNGDYCNREQAVAESVGLRKRWSGRERGPTRKKGCRTWR